MVQAAINASGSEFEMGVFLPLGGGSKKTTMMLRGAGASWVLFMKRVMVEHLGDKHF